MSDVGELTRLTPGQQIVFGGNRVVSVGAELAEAFRPGDRLVVVQSTGALVHIPARIAGVVDGAITAAAAAFSELARCSDEAIVTFFKNVCMLFGRKPPAAAASCTTAPKW